MTAVPFSNSAAFFKDAAEPAPEPIFPAPDVGPENRSTCRWCLRPFDVAAATPRSTAELGHLNGNLKMPDTGKTLVCCDDCFQGAIGARVLIHGRVVPGNPEVVDNPLLRALA